jgi:superoxide dismutase
MNSKEIKPTDGRKGNSRKKSIPKLPVPPMQRSNKPALNQAKKSRKKQYAKKAIKNVFGSEVAMFESMAKKAKEGSYNHMKLLTDMMYEEEKENNSNSVKAPIINFFGDSEIGEKVKKKVIDVTPKDE